MAGRRHRARKAYPIGKRFAASIHRMNRSTTTMRIRRSEFALSPHKPAFVSEVQVVLSDSERDGLWRQPYTMILPDTH